MSESLKYRAGQTGTKSLQSGKGVSRRGMPWSNIFIPRRKHRRDSINQPNFFIPRRKPCLDGALKCERAGDRSAQQDDRSGGLPDSRSAGRTVERNSLGSGRRSGRTAGRNSPGAGRRFGGKAERKNSGAGRRNGLTAGHNSPGVSRVISRSFILKTAAFFLILPAFLLLFSCSPELPPEGKSYAFLYGVTDFSLTGQLNLYFTDDDAIALGALLSEQGWTAEIRINGGTAEYGPATKDQLLEDMAFAAENVSTSDRVLFFFSTHGGPEDSLPYRTTEPPLSEDQYGYDEKIILYDEALYDDELGEMLKGIATRKKMVIIDACNSAGFIGTQQTAEGFAAGMVSANGYAFFFNYDDFLNYYLTNNSIRLFLYFPELGSVDVPAWDTVVLSAAGELESSAEPSTEYEPHPFPEHGYFTYALMMGAEKDSSGHMQADRNWDGYVTVLEAYEYAGWWLTDTGGGSFGFLPRISGSPFDIVLFE